MIDYNITREEARTVSCPTCGAGVSIPCQEKGKARPANHQDRVTAYRENPPQPPLRKPTAPQRTYIRELQEHLDLPQNTHEEFEVMARWQASNLILKLYGEYERKARAASREADRTNLGEAVLDFSPDIESAVYERRWDRF